MTVEHWRMQSGRIGEIDLSQDPATVESLRVLLRSQDAEPIQEDAPAAGGNQREGEIVSIPIPGESTNMTIEAPTTDARESVQDVFDDIERLGGPVQLLPKHALFQQIPDTKVKTAAQIDDVEIEIGLGWFWFATVLDADGRDVTGIHSEQWDEALGSLSLGARRTVLSTPNAAMRLGEHLVISHGEYIPIAKVGDDAYELISRDEWRRRERAARNAFADEHPVILESKPAWADSVDVDAIDEKSGEADIVYGRSFGPVELSRAAVYVDGGMRFDDDTDRPFVTLAKHEDLTLEEMRELASAIMAAIPVVEEATA